MLLLLLQSNLIPPLSSFIHKTVHFQRTNRIRFFQNKTGLTSCAFHKKIYEVRIYRQIFSEWVCRPNPEDRVNRKPEDRKNDQRTENPKNHKTEKMNSTVLNQLLT